MSRNVYRLSVPQPHAHLLDVEARFRELPGDDTVDLEMAAWTPGSYLVREYARHVQELSVTDGSGRPLGVTKAAKATWRVSARGATELVARYRVYGWELSVRTNHVDATHAFVNGAPTFLWIASRGAEPAIVEVDAPQGWTFVSALPAEGANRFVAANLDELIDSPMLGLAAGAGSVRETTAADKPLVFAVLGAPDAGGVATLDQLVADSKAIAEHYASIFGGVPYRRYVFLLMLFAEAYGGLEHRHSASLLSTPFAFATRKKYEELLELVSHEYFHLWNVKRIRPRQLGPFAYDRENYTRALWVAEGLTSYYDRHTLRRARLQTGKRYLERLCEEWARYLAIPGRFRQSVEESSFDAWIKLYRPDENSVNSTVSYYLKGGLVCLALDLEIRRRTEGRRSLDDVLRLLWSEYGARDRGFDDVGVQRDFERAVELDLGETFERCVRGREDPDLGRALAGVGLELRAKVERNGDEERPPAAWLGVNTKTEAGRFVVAQALAGGPAEQAGLYAGDELVALDGFRVDERSLGERIGARRPGDRARVTLFRRERLQELDVTLGVKPKDAFEIVASPSASETERALCRAWLGEDAAEPAK
jgi:predicted metalloprotease with PDZ domain